MSVFMKLLSPQGEVNLSEFHENLLTLNLLLRSLNKSHLNVDLCLCLIPPGAT